LIDRTNEQINYADAQFNSGIPGDNGDDEANEHEAYFNPDSGFAASEQAAVQCP
jgi:hypothetical protein